MRKCYFVIAIPDLSRTRCLFSLISILLIGDQDVAGFCISFLPVERTNIIQEIVQPILAPKSPLAMDC